MKFREVQAGHFLHQGYVPENVTQVKISQIEHRLPIKNSVFRRG